jgi:hypothetical protein
MKNTVPLKDIIKNFNTVNKYSFTEIKLSEAFFKDTLVSSDTIAIENKYAGLGRKYLEKQCGRIKFNDVLRCDKEDFKELTCKNENLINKGSRKYFYDEVERTKCFVDKNRKEDERYYYDDQYILKDRKKENYDGEREYFGKNREHYDGQYRKSRGIFNGERKFYDENREYYDEKYHRNRENCDENYIKNKNKFHYNHHLKNSDKYYFNGDETSPFHNHKLFYYLDENTESSSQVNLNFQKTQINYKKFCDESNEMFERKLDYENTGSGIFMENYRLNDTFDGDDSFLNCFNYIESELEKCESRNGVEMLLKLKKEYLRIRFSLHKN